MTLLNPSIRFPFGVSDFSTAEPLLNAEKIIGCGMDFIEPGLANDRSAPQTKPVFETHFCVGQLSGLSHTIL